MPPPTGPCLVDTNIPLRLNEPTSAQYALARAAMTTLMMANHPLCIAPQNIIEFWSVATKPAGAPSNGLGLSLAATEALIETMKNQFTVLDESPAVYAQWERIVKAVQVIGPKVHDARLAAFMSVYAIPNILTFNVKDFKRFESIAGITVIDPASI